MNEIEYLFDSSGSWIAFRKEANLFLPSGEWIGWLSNDSNKAVDLNGAYLGTIIGDHRLLREVYASYEEAPDTPGYPGRESAPDDPLYPGRYDLPSTMEDVGLVQNV